MDDIRVTFLGTSSASPTLARNVASLAVTLDGRVLLFDCGEGTQQQLLRSTVRSGSIDAIFITHLHGDHLFGLPGLLATLGLNARSAPLTIYGPPGLAPFLDAVPYLGNPYEIFVAVIEEGEVMRGDGFTVIAAPLDHRIECFGFCIIEDDRRGTFDVDRAVALGVPEGPQFAQLHRGEDVVLDDGRIVRSADVVGATRRGRRVAYCTDTRPCANAISLARDAELLIHESTYAADMATEAHERGHATTVEAARVAAEARCERLLLTHFSSRYVDVAPLIDEARAIFPATDAAADFMTVRV
ncbi:MAG: ribonuclease [Acidobacteria bacterium]|nr:ribonuclease [Acidobacteriota bacterium]